MDFQTPVLAIIPDESGRAAADNLAAALGYPHANVVVGSPATAAAMLEHHRYTPRYVLISIGARQHDVLPEIDQLALHCDASTRVVVLGETNDISFYRALTERGVSEYFAHAAGIDEIRRALFVAESGDSAQGNVVAFVGSSASDGSSTLAVNTAYLLAATHKKKTVLVDLDYQFGMAAKQLDLNPPYGIKELFEHPERGIDDTLVSRMTATYRGNLDVIAAPVPLQLLPNIAPDTVRELIAALQRKYDYVVLDIPHLWTNWISTALTSSQHLVLVSQLWLKSVTHASRMLAVWQRLGLTEKHLITVINRSGSKFKEAIGARDFERVCSRKIDFYVPNDIKTIVRSENEGKTIVELGNSLIASEMQRLAAAIIAQADADRPAGTRRAS